MRSFFKKLEIYKRSQIFSQRSLKVSRNKNHFINLCNKAEDKNGYIKNNFINLISNGYYKFKTSPFADIKFLNF